MRLLRPLRHGPVALLWGGLTLSAIGDQLYIVALAWIATGVFGAAAGYLSAFQALVVVLVAVFGGGLADRLPPLRAMLGADLARAAILALVVGLWMATGEIGAIGLAAAVLVLAVGQAVFHPALQAKLPALVPDPALLPAANGLFDATERSARLLGPGLVVLLAATIPTMHFLTVDAATFLVSAAALVAILRTDAPGAAPRPGSAAVPGGALANIRTGIRAMRRHPLLGYVLETSAFNNGAWYGHYFLVLPLLLKEQAVRLPSGDGLGAYGLLIALYGCTNLASNVVCGSRLMPARPQFQMFTGTVLVGAGMATFALLPALPEVARLPVAMAGALVSGLGGPMADIPIAVLRQIRVPRPEIAAAVRARLAASSLGALVAMLLLPQLLPRIPLWVAVAGCGAVEIGLGVIGLLRFAAWRETGPGSTSI